MAKAVRLDKFLADAGKGTRSEVKKFIQKGQVQVNGVPAKKPEMKVDPEKQNYFTARFWGSDSGNSNILILFCEGKQIGYRHLGDYDVLDIANEDKPYPGRFTYTTLPLPISMTRGKKEIELSIRSTGRIFRYGETFDAYQKVMEKPSKALYKGYTHTETCFQPSEKEKKQIEKIERRVRTAPGAEVMEEVRQFVNRQISGYLNQTEIDQETASLLAYAYHEPWTGLSEQGRGGEGHPYGRPVL